MKINISFMKTIYFIVTAFFIVFTLNACHKNTGTIEPASSSTIVQTNPGIKPADGDIPFKFRIVGADEATADKHSFTFIKCQSTEELKQYLGDNMPEEYDDNFFKDNTLALSFRKSPTGSGKYIVKSVKRTNGNIFFDIDSEVPQIVTYDMSYCCIIIELNNSYLTDDDNFTLPGLDTSMLKSDS